MKKLLLTLLLCGLCARAADKKISELPAVTALGATDTIEVVQAGVNSKITVANAFTLAAGVTFDASAATVLLPPFSVPFLIPGSASPTVDAVGETAYDSDAWAASRAALKFFDGTAATNLIGVLTSDTPTNLQVPKWNTGGTITWEDSASGAAVADATGTATLSIVVGAAATAMRSDASPAISQAIAPTWTDAHIFSKAGAASVPAIKATGVPFAGTGTTSFPLVYINDPAATASTTLSTAGTYIGVNGDGTQDLMNLLKDGTSQFKVSSTGIVTVSNEVNSFVLGINSASGYINLVNVARISGTAAGVLNIYSNNGAILGRLNFGNSAINSNPAIGGDAVNGFTFQSGAGTATWNDSSTAGSGTVANRYLVGIAAPTLTATNASVTDTVASTVYIGGAPTASTNTTITTPYALNVAAGVSKFGGPVVLPVYATVAALPSTAATGMVTGAMAVVQDATAPTYNAAVTGGGAVVVCVYYNGTVWISH